MGNEQVRKLLSYIHCHHSLEEPRVARSVSDFCGRYGISAEGRVGSCIIDTFQLRLTCEQVSKLLTTGLYRSSIRIILWPF